MRKLDITRAALVGVTADRKEEIGQPFKLSCDGCGTDVYISEPCIEPAKQAVAARGQKLYYLCPSCAQPFLDATAREGRDLEATRMAMKEILPDIERRRREFLRNN
jgi:hypothetical protein